MWCASARSMPQLTVVGLQERSQHGLRLTVAWAHFSMSLGRSLHPMPLLAIGMGPGSNDRGAD